MNYFELCSEILYSILRNLAVAGHYKLSVLFDWLSSSFILRLPTSVFLPRVTQFLPQRLHQSNTNSPTVLCSRVSVAGQHRLLLQLWKRRPSRVPVRSLQGAAQSIIRDKQ